MHRSISVYFVGLGAMAEIETIVKAVTDALEVAEHHPTGR